MGGYDGARHISMLLQQRNSTLEFLIDEGVPITDGVVTGIQGPVAV